MKTPRVIIAKSKGRSRWSQYQELIEDLGVVRYLYQLVDDNPLLFVRTFTMRSDSASLNRFKISCETIDNIFKFLDEELDNQSSFSVSEENLIQTLKFELRYVRMHLKWHSTLNDPLLCNMSTWVEDVKKRLHQITREVSVVVGFPEEKLSGLFLTMKVGKAILRKQCSFYYEDEQYGLNFTRRDITTNELLLECIDPLLENLNHLSRCNDLSFLISPKEKIEALAEKLRSLRNILEISRRELEEAVKNVMPVQDLLTCIKRIIENAIYISCYSWAKGKQKRIEKLLSYMQVKIDHIEPEIRMIYAQLMKASKLANPCTLGIDLKALATVDSLLDNLQKLQNHQETGCLMSSDVHQIEFLHQELSFVKYFLLDPHWKQYPKTGTQSFNFLLIQLEAIAREGTSLTQSVISACQTKDHMACEMNLLHSSLLEVVKLLKDDITQVYLRVDKPSISGFPRTPKLGLLESFLQRLDEVLKCRSDSISYVKNKIKVVQSEMRFLSSLDIIKEPGGDEDVAKHVVDVACEAEHVIDLISASNLPNWYYMSWLSDIIQKIKMVRSDTTEVCSKKACDSSAPNVEIRASTKYPSHDYTIVAEEVVLGLDSECQSIIDQLIGGSEKLSSLTIAGMGGVGKTTLAKKVYNHPSIRKHFDICSWCHVSHVYIWRDLLLDLLSNVTEHNEEILKMDDKDMAEALCKSLEGNRYLIVLDDVWDSEVWSISRNSLPDECNGSRILFTTRVSDIGIRANPRFVIHFLRPLPDYEAWELLHNKLFKNRMCPPKLSKIGKEIASRCKGLPLYVVLISGILRLDENENHWKQILESLDRHSHHNHLSKNVEELSYNYLPDHLKACFLCLGAFPEEREIPTWKLIRLWIAEGLVSKTMSESLEKVAAGYLMDLISRGLISVAKNKTTGGVKTCRVHQVIHDLSSHKAHIENFLETSFGRPHNTNYVRYRQHFYIKHTIGWMPSNPYVRSLFLSPVQKAPLSLLSNTFYNLPAFDLSVLPYLLKVLRVLDLERVLLDSATFPTEIELLVHLRYLALHGIINHVSSSIGSLWRLETFVLVGKEGEVKLPETLFKMAKLKHVYVRDEAFFAFPETFQPEKFSMSDGIENLSTLSLRLGDETTEKIMICLRSLRRLKCNFLESLDYGKDCNQFPVLNILNKLESLSMTYDGSMKVKCPPEFSFPSNLKKLTLSNFCLPWSEISKIGRLPQLEVLKLLSRAFEGKRWDVSRDEFRKLNVLKLESLDIREWDASPCAFPCLELLVLEKCNQLEELPSSFGELTTLKMIQVLRCSYSIDKFVRKIQEQHGDLCSDGLKVHIQHLKQESAPAS